MELKPKIPVSAGQLLKPFNQTRMELKRCPEPPGSPAKDPFNQTRMELKPGYLSHKTAPRLPFNQTRMELKRGQ